MEFKSPATPRRLYHASNICILCGFAFIQTEVLASGEQKEIKFLNRKLKITKEKVDTIKLVIDEFSHDLSSSNGVCKTCFRSVERVLRLENEVKGLQNEIKVSRSAVRRKYQLASPSPGRPVTEKRLLRSPSTSTSEPKKPFSSTINVVNLVAIPPLPEASNVESTVTSHSTLPAPESKSVRRSLGFSSQAASKVKEKDDQMLEGEVKLTVFYPSGKRKFFVFDENHRKMCRAISRGTNVEKNITDMIVSTHPDVIIKAAAKIIATESGNHCKRGSGALLQLKSLQDFLTFDWKSLYDSLTTNCPSLVSVLSAAVSQGPLLFNTKPYYHMLVAAAICLHGNNQEMSLIQYFIGFILTHGGCTLKDIERLSSIGLSVHPRTLHNKLSEWQHQLDTKILALRESWDAGRNKYRLVGDNWDKNILPSYRTSEQKTKSIHLFNVIAVVDRLNPKKSTCNTTSIKDHIEIADYIPSVAEQEILLEELTFVLASSVINNLPQFEKIFKGNYPKHLQHKYSHIAGVKTEKYPLGLFKCNENKTQELIKLLKELSEKYVPMEDNMISEAVFFGGDRLTDERIQGAQKAMQNAASPKEKLEGFISKIEDFHRLMNFLEAIFNLAYSTESSQDPGTLYYFRNLLNLRNVKGKVKNAYRNYKMLFYTVLDAIILVLFLEYFGLNDLESTVPLPDSFNELTSESKTKWLNDVCKTVLRKWFFDEGDDVCETLRSIATDPDHLENYWLSTKEQNGRLKCHFCERTYSHVGTLQIHETRFHNITIQKPAKPQKNSKQDQLHEYIFMCFKLILLHKNLDSAIDMGDGQRSVRSAKYELPIYNKTNKIKYAIGSVHLTALTSGLLPPEQTERLVANRFINLQGGKNNNVALDEYVEMLNRDSKAECSGHQTVDSIIAHSKEYPHIVNITKHFDEISGVTKKKGFHHLPSYKLDVITVAKKLIKLNVIDEKPGRKLKAKGLTAEKNPFDTCFRDLSTIIHRHKPMTPFRRLRDPHI